MSKKRKNLAEKVNELTNFEVEENFFTDANPSAYYLAQSMHG
jgi:hypothetical protein